MLARCRRLSWMRPEGRPRRLDQAVEPLTALINICVRAVVQALPQVSQFAEALHFRGCAQLGRRRWRGRAQVGHEIGQCEVRLMSDAAHHGHRGLRDGAYQHRVVERPQVFQRTASAHEQQHLAFTGFGMPPVSGLQRGAQFGWRLRALHGRRVDDHRDVGHPPLQRGDHIAQGRRAQRRDDTDAARLHGQRTFAGLLEQALGLQLGLELEELLEQRALSCRLQRLDNELQIATSTVDIKLATRLDQLTIAGGKTQLLGRAAEHGATHLADVVLERKITMPAGRPRKARKLAPNRHRIESGRDGIGHGSHQGANRPHTPRRRQIGIEQGFSHAHLRRKCVHKPRRCWQF